MLKVSRSTERAIRSGLKPEELGELHFDLDTYQEGLRRQSEVNKVMTYGCGVCCNMFSVAGENRIQCPLLITDDPRLHLEPEERQKAQNCKVPQLYADIADGKQASVKEEEVLALVPEFLDFDQIRELNEKKSTPSPPPPPPPQPSPEPKTAKK